MSLEPYGHTWEPLKVTKESWVPILTGPFVFPVWGLYLIYFGGEKLVKIHLWEAFSKFLSPSIAFYPLTLLMFIELTHLINFFGWTSTLYPLQCNFHDGGTLLCYCALTIYKSARIRVITHYLFNERNNEKCYIECLLTAGHPHPTWCPTSTHRLHKEEGRGWQGCKCIMGSLRTQ